jgi:hypothetical protein
LHISSQSTCLSILIAAAALLLWGAPSAAAQAPAGDGDPAPAATTPQVGGPTASGVDEEDDPAVLDPAEPDFVVVNLPTTLRLPRFKGNFRLTHRFSGNLRSGSFSQNASNLFGLDQGAIIGFEFRMNLMRDLQAAVFRTNLDKTFQFYGKYDALRQRGALPVSISGIVSVEGRNNFQDAYAPAVGLVVSHQMAERLALYATPFWVGHTNASTSGEPYDKRGTVFVGLGARARVTSTVYAVGEVLPRAGGYAPDDVAYGFGIEKRVGGHAFALTFTNSFGTTFAQLARGGTGNSLYLGFNLGRKFY